MKSYLITDPSFYTSNPEIFKQKLLHVADKTNPDFICLRDKQTKDYNSLAVVFKQMKMKTKKLLHSDFRLAYKLGFWGVHLTSSQFEDIKKAKDLNLHVVVSTHSLEDALHVEKEGADFITYSPIFYTPNKGIPKGLEKLKEINDKIDIKCFALGGIIEKKQVELCKSVGVYGFASIRYFTNKVII